MKKLFITLLLFVGITQARQITTSNYTNTPYRERMKSNVSSAILVGVVGTVTGGDTCVGTYVYTFQMHQFPVEKTGMYLLYEDILGGTNYALRSDWSGPSGKLVIGKSSYWPEPTYIHSYLGDLFGSPVFNDSILFRNSGQGRDSSFFNVGVDSAEAPSFGMIKIRKPADIRIPGSVVIAANRDYKHTGHVNSIIDISGTHDVSLSGGVLYGRADSCAYNNGMTEYDCGIEIKSSNDVRVSDISILYPSGDGVGVGCVQWPTLNGVDTTYYLVESKRINLSNLYVYCPTIKMWNWPAWEQIGRNSVAVTGAGDVVISGAHLYGGVPAVIDVEGNTSVVDTVENLIITNCVIDGLCSGDYIIGSRITNTQFYIKSKTGTDLNLAENDLVNEHIMSNDYGNIPCKFGSTARTDWQSITANTATSGGNTTITVGNAWYSDPTGYYAVIYNHSEDWPAIPDTANLFDDGLISSYSGSSPYTITVSGISATLNQLVGYRLYLTDNPIHGIKRHISANANSVGDSVLITVNDSFLGMTPAYGISISTGDGFGSGISIGGSPRYRNIVITNNIIKNCRDYGIRVQQGGSDTTHKILIANNVIENCFDVGIETAGTHNVKMIGNKISSCNLGINGMGNANSIQSNNIINCPSGGIWILGNAGNDSTGTIENSTVTNNTIINCGYAGTTYPEESIWMAWTKNSSCSNNTIVNIDTATSLYQRAMYFLGCKNLFLGDNNIVGYAGRYWWHDYSTFDNTIFNYNKGNFGVNVVTSSHTFTVADTIGSSSYTAIDGGVIYPNAVSPSNKINVNGSTLQLIGGTTVVLAALDTNDVQQTLLTASIDTLNNKSVQVRGVLQTIEMEQTDIYQAQEHSWWMNTNKDTLWFKYGANNSAYILIDGTVSGKH